MFKWEDGTYEFKLSTLGGSGGSSGGGSGGSSGGSSGSPPPLIALAPYTFKMNPFPPLGTKTDFYQIVPTGTAAGIPFENCALLPQAGRELTVYIPSSLRLDPLTNPNYTKALGDLVADIIRDQIADNPDSFERLVGFIARPGRPVNPVTFYKVEHTHKDDTKALVIVLAKLQGTAPGGSIVIIS